jgi:hypothetical protein
MHLASHPPVRRAAARAGLLALMIGAAFGLTQCVQVTDPVSRSTVAEFSTTTSDCFSGCAKVFAANVRAEASLHSANMKTCTGDPVCVSLEIARHQQVMTQLQDDFTNCRNGCHHQGGGTGGSAVAP